MPLEIEGIKFYSVVETARILKVGDQTVRRYIQLGRLRGQRIGRSFQVTARSLHEFLNLPEETVKGAK